VLIARLESPADTEALWEVKLANEPNAKWRRKAFKMKKGLNHVRIEFECRPGEIFEWKFTPGKVPGDYIFKPIPEAQMLRENVKTIRHFPSQL
jgi:hypothetical protein